jgi:hypothetical protein
MVATRRLADLTVPWGRQEIQLEEIDFESGGVPLLRVRIREGRRFTIFDVDAATAAAWAQAMQAWSDTQAAAAAAQRP